MSTNTDNIIENVKFNAHGLVTAVVQDIDTNQILMVAYMNKDTLAETLQSGRMVYWSRSRKKRWLKGETSGHFQYVKEVYIDCDGDALLFKVEQIGPACHEGYKSCFFRKSNNDSWEIVLKKDDE